MTTESKQDLRSSGVSVLLGAAGAALVLGAIFTLLGAFVSGSPAAYGALAGSVLVVTVFALGSFVVNVVAGLMPAASLLVALMTYTLQVILMALVFVGLSGSGLLDGALSREWLAGGVITGTLTWLTAQVVLTTRLRLPVYELPEPGVGSHADEGRSRGPEAGAP